MVVLDSSGYFLVLSISEGPTMSCAWTICNFCGHLMNHVLVRECKECGSKDVEHDFDPDEMYEDEEATEQ